MTGATAFVPGTDKDAVRFLIKVTENLRGAADISAISAYPNEAETLIASGSEFTILSTSEVSYPSDGRDRIHITIEMMTSDY